MNQARTKLVLEHLSGEFDNYSFLQGKTGKGQWDPVSIVLEYDSTTNTHRYIDREEGEELFDDETVQRIWGERKSVRVIVGILNRIKRHGFSDRAIAERLGIAHTSIAKWRTSKNKPTPERLTELQDWLAKLDGKNAISGHRRLQKAGSMGTSGEFPIQNVQDHTYNNNGAQNLHILTGAKATIGAKATKGKSDKAASDPPQEYPMRAENSGGEPMKA